MSTLYIPPQQLSFRILGTASDKVLFSRWSPEPTFYHHPREEEYSDQWWHLIPGTGSHAGYFLFKSKSTAKVIFSRKSPDPRVGAIEGDGKYQDNWFKLEPGTGKHAGRFRIRSDATQTALFSRLTPSPQVGNHQLSDAYDDQFFTYLFEDMKVDRIVYHVDAGKIVASTPEVIGTQTQRNNTTVDQTVEFTFSRTEEISHTFEYTLGFTITIGATGKVGIPFVAEGEIKVEASNSHEFKWGTTATESRTYTARFPATAPPHSKITATASVTRSNIDVPFTLYSKSVATGFEVATEGIYRGVTYWDLKSEITQEPL